MKTQLVVTALLIGAGMAGAGEEPAYPTGPGSAELERIKSLAGRWEGTSQQEGSAEEPAAAEYKVTSGGSAVVETLFPGTPHEMVSVYRDGRDGKLTMTHYCMLRNQPELILTGATDQQVDLALSPASAIPASEPHMHAVTIAWADSDHLTQTWTSYKEGQADSSVIIRLNRNRSAAD